MNANFPLLSSSQEEGQPERPWLTFYDPQVSPSLAYRHVALYAFLDEAARKTPNALACHFHSTQITYATLCHKAEVVAANLQARGVKPGDRVGIMLPNLPQTLIVFWGILKAGAIGVMVNPLYMEKELLHLIHDAGIEHLVAFDQCWPKLEALREQLGVTHFYITGVSDSLRFPYSALHRVASWRNKNRIRVPYDGKNVIPYNDLLAGRAKVSVPVENPETTPALLQYTGGTTGRSKGVVLTHKNLVANIQQAAAHLHNLEQGREVFMAVLPLFHVYGLTTCLLLPVLLRACVVPVPRFSATDLLGQLDKYKVSILPGAPSMYIALLQQKRAKKRALSQLKYCISGSAPMPIEYLHRFEQEFSAILIEGYGLSEASPITHLNPACGKRKIGSIGVPLPDTQARIVDMELGVVPMPSGKVGELVLRGPQVMPCYWNCPDETANTLRNGWLYTGDIAVMDEEGYFTIVDRKKDMIIVGGYNVAPREIDEVLYEHPKVQEAVTVGVSHPTRGEIIKACVVLRPGETMERAEVLGWCRQKLAGYKVPRQVEFRDALPKTFVGKILRRTLREEEAQKHRAGTLAEEPVFQENGGAEETSASRL